MTKPTPELWVKIIETHGYRAKMGLILTTCAGLSLVIIASGAVWNVVANPSVTDITEGFLTLLGTSLGTVFGGVIGYLSAQNITNKATGEVVNEGDLSVKIDPPPPESKT